MDKILYETIIPLMMISERDVNLFQDDPIEYIRKQQDLMETVYMPKNTSATLLQLICGWKSDEGAFKAKPDYLMPYLAFASTNM